MVGHTKHYCVHAWTAKGYSGKKVCYGLDEVKRKFLAHAFKKVATTPFEVWQGDIVDGSHVIGWFKAHRTYIDCPEAWCGPEKWGVAASAVAS